ncbi:unnamed protein product [Paramecium octaurelia]|uniref:Uncharacterized protein n=1 Tax=Paramecium octaurelia TaxID=43137 RepID=A0A8S1U0L7_PAROT|nr:unnamed protein product [Paramecium octaurelia]
MDNLRHNNLKLKLKLISSKKSISFILEKTKLKELEKLSEVVNLDKFLLNIIEDFPKSRTRENVNFNALLNELQNIEITDLDFENNLSKQKGILKYHIFKQGWNEKLIEQEEKDLELIENGFGELFTKESAPKQISVENIKKIFEDGSYKKDLRSCSLVQQKGINFQFVHTSIQEFFVAANLYGILVLFKDFRSLIFNQILIQHLKENNYDQNFLEYLQNQINQQNLIIGEVSIRNDKKNIEQTLDHLRALKKHKFLPRKLFY